MRAPLLRVAFPALLLLALTACSPAADKQREEQAIASGEAHGASPTDPLPAACGRAKGQWDAESSRCNLTPAMCADTGTGAWRDGTGCVVAVDSQEACSGFSGMRWSQGTCVIDFLDGAELAQNGF